MTTLRVIAGPAAGRSLELRSEVVIGRAEADLTIEDSELSRRHAAVRPADSGGVVVEDLGSTNGTFIAGERITAPVTLTSGATIVIGTSQIAIELPIRAEVTRAREVPEPAAGPPSGAGQPPVVEVLTGPAAGRSLELREDVIVGREGADLTIDDPELSRRHTRLSPTEGGVLVEDLGSTNGTILDGRRLERPVPLDRDATIEVGTTRLALRLPGPALTRARAVPVGDAEPTRARPQPPPPPPEAPPAPPPEAPPAAAAAPPPAPADGAPGPPPKAAPGREWAIRGGVLAIVAAIVLVLVLAQDWGTKKSHRLNELVRTTILSQTGIGVLVGGVSNGPPLGPGSAVLNQTFHLKPGQVPLAPGFPTPYSGKLVGHFAQGSIIATYKGTVTTQPDGSTVNVGDGEIIDGTGKYKDATGTLKQTGGRPPNSSLATFRFTGTIKY